MNQVSDSQWIPFAQTPGIQPAWQDQNGVWHLSRWKDVNQVMTAPGAQVDVALKDKMERVARAFPGKYTAWRFLFGLTNLSNGEAHELTRSASAELVGGFHDALDPAGIDAQVADFVRDAGPDGADVISGLIDPILDRWSAAAFDADVDRMRELRARGIDFLFTAGRGMMGAGVGQIEDKAVKAQEAYRRALNLSGDTFGAKEHAIFTLVVSGVGVLSAFCTNILEYLADTPDMQDRLRNQPELRAGFLREAERLMPPTRYLHRLTGPDGVTLEDGTELPGNAPMVVDLISANRDRDLCENPQEMSPERPRCPHLGFAVGPHRCLGIQATRRFAPELLNAVLDTARISRAGAPQPRESNLFFERLPALNLRFEAIG